MPFPLISGAPRAPVIQFPLAGPAHSVPQHDRRPSPQAPPQDLHLTATAPPVSIPATARAPPAAAPIKQTPKPLLKQAQPAGSIGRSFRAAKERLTRSADEPEPKRPPKRKEKEDGRQLFIIAKSILLRLARAAGRRTRIFFWKSKAAPRLPMHLDPLYRHLFSSEFLARYGAAASYSPGASRPATGATGPPALHL
jgi:hypothetical protein